MVALSIFAWRAMELVPELLDALRSIEAADVAVQLFVEGRSGRRGHSEQLGEEPVVHLDKVVCEVSVRQLAEIPCFFGTRLGFGVGILFSA